QGLTLIPRIAFLSDIEGIWSKLSSFCASQELVKLVPDGQGALRLEVSEGAVFVFGGDAIDRGPDGRRIIRTLLDAKLRQPDRVVLIAGNRDVNKMRLVRELSGYPPSQAPADVISTGPGALLGWLFAHTMGAAFALRMRVKELEGERS